MNKKLDFKIRPLSWSAIASFQYNPEQWYEKYILGIKQPSNGSMDFGKWFGEILANDPEFYPQIPRYERFEHKLSIVFNKIPIIGYIDSYDPKTHSFYEYKTSKTLWSREKSENHGQLLLYALAIYITYKKLPKEINLVCIKTKEDGDFKVSISDPVEIVNYPVKVEMKDILAFGVKVLKTVKEMESYAQAHD